MVFGIPQVKQLAHVAEATFNGAGRIVINQADNLAHAGYSAVNAASHGGYGSVLQNIASKEQDKVFGAFRSIFDDVLKNAEQQLAANPEIKALYEKVATAHGVGPEHAASFLKHDLQTGAGIQNAYNMVYGGSFHASQAVAPQAVSHIPNSGAFQGNVAGTYNLAHGGQYANGGQVYNAAHGAEYGVSHIGQQGGGVYHSDFRNQALMAWEQGVPTRMALFQNRQALKDVKEANVVKTAIENRITALKATTPKKGSPDAKELSALEKQLKTMKKSEKKAEKAVKKAEKAVTKSDEPFKFYAPLMRHYNRYFG